MAKKKYTKAELEALRRYYKSLEESEATARRKNLKKKLELEKARFLYGD